MDAERLGSSGQTAAWRRSSVVVHGSVLAVSLAAFAAAALLTDAPADDAPFVVIAVFALGLPWSFFGWALTMQGSPVLSGIVIALTTLLNLGIHVAVQASRARDAREAAASAERWEL